LQGDLEAGAIQREQFVALMDDLVIPDLQLGDEAGDVGRDLGHIGAYAAVAGPGLDLITVPHPAGDLHRDDHHQQGDDDPEGQHGGAP
jgi:hypothetical protein